MDTEVICSTNMDKFLENSDLFKFLRAGRNYKISKKQIIQTTGDRQVVNLVAGGFIKRYMITNDGSIGVQITYGRGDVFPLTLVYSTLYDQSIYHGRETYYYEAMSDAEVFTVNAADLKEEAQKNPQIHSDLLQVAGMHLESCVHSLENLALKTAYKRVAHQLVYFARSFGTKTARGIAIETPLTHQDLADILSLTRETVSTSMVELRKKKLILTGKQIIIPEIGKLQDEAYE